MKVGLREKLFLVSAAVLVVSGAAAFAWLSRELESDTRQRLHRDALARSTLLAREIELRGGTLEPAAAWDGLADDLAFGAEGRVTIFAADGRVAGDSALDLSAIVDLGGASAAGSRSPEARAALGG